MASFASLTVRSQQKSEGDFISVGIASGMVWYLLSLPDLGVSLISQVNLAAALIWFLQNRLSVTRFVEGAVGALIRKNLCGMDWMLVMIRWGRMRIGRDRRKRDQTVCENDWEKEKKMLFRYRHAPCIHLVCTTRWWIPFIYWWERCSLASSIP